MLVLRLMDTSENPEMMKMKGFRSPIQANRKVTSPKWSRIIIQSFWPYLFHKYTTKIATKCKQNTLLWLPYVCPISVCLPTWLPNCTFHQSQISALGWGRDAEAGCRGCMQAASKRFIRHLLMILQSIALVQGFVKSTQHWLIWLCFSINALMFPNNLIQ